MQGWRSGTRTLISTRGRNGYRALTSRALFLLRQCPWLQEAALMILFGPPLLALTWSSVTSTTCQLPRLRQLWDGVFFSFIHKKEGRHSPPNLRAALFGDWTAPERLVTDTRYLGARRTIEGTATTERAARCAAARTACGSQ